MAKAPEAVIVQAELILRYASGKETSLGTLGIQQHLHYHFSFVPTGEPLPEGAIIESLARIESPEGAS